ncbi:glycine/D-amino acid oxidase-like deaminating enzyme [Flavobacteriaceae bacterium MAR_2010_72]|nr:glycine/D-amino acid oxidase-like deaminating enzyme [Flavobacteriaceae bacterium MAR_2010_72]
MKHVDYIVVGCGLAGIAFCEQLREHSKSFIVFDNESQHSSTVAAGLYNPIILKRFTEVWKAKQQLDLALPKYAQLEELLGVKLDYKLPVYRKFASIEEQNEWFSASDKPSLEPFLSPKLVKNHNVHMNAPFGFGEVLGTGRIDTEALVKNYRAFLKNSNRLIIERFEYPEVNGSNNEINYKNIKANYIIFAEGFGLVKNPYFKNLPLRVAKGELLTIKAPELKLNGIIKSAVFISPLGDDLYSVGATYNWEDQTNAVTSQARNELTSKLKRIINCEFEIVDQRAGIRPTVNDRRPLVGVHPKHKTIFVLNGLGTRGVMLAPYLAKQLYEFIEENTALENEINITRFTSLIWEN